jgi:ADP-dependent phosphofructokinase/glucokinase
VPVVHLEMAGYDTPSLRDRTLEGLHGSYTSLGLSESEYRDLVASPRPHAETIVATAEALGTDRLCIHADAWALAATRGDPHQERTALMMGSLLAATRAAFGRPAKPDALPAGATFSAPPAERRIGAWNLVSCATPYLPRPSATVGLGDTFMAGCLLVLGQPHPPDRGEDVVVPKTTKEPSGTSRN